MSVLDAVAYVADVAILVTYFMIANGHHPKWFHWANAVGGVPVITVEVVGRAWPPMVLTAAFCLIGWWGVITDG